MSDYKNRMKEWITNMVREELTEDDSWWTSMSADQQADYIKRHPQSQKAMDAKKEKGDEEPKKLSSDEIDKKIKDLGDKIRNIYQSGMSPQDSERYIAGIQKQIDDLKSQKESITINGKRYKPVKESKKNPHVLKENYDRIFRSLK